MDDGGQKRSQLAALDQKPLQKCLQIENRLLPEADYNAFGGICMSLDGEADESERYTLRLAS